MIVYSNLLRKEDGGVTAGLILRTVVSPRKRNHRFLVSNKRAKRIKHIVVGNNKII